MANSFNPRSQPIQGTTQEVKELRENANKRILDFINTTNTRVLFQSLRFTDEASNRVKPRGPLTTKLQGIRIGAGENDEFVCTVDICNDVLRKIGSKLGYTDVWDMSKGDICLNLVTLWNANNNSNNSNNNNNNNDYLDDDGEEGKEAEEEEEEEEEETASSSAGRIGLNSILAPPPPPTNSILREEPMADVAAVVNGMARRGRVVRWEDQERTIEEQRATIRQLVETVGNLVKTNGELVAKLPATVRDCDAMDDGDEEEEDAASDCCLLRTTKKLRRNNETGHNNDQIASPPTAIPGIRSNNETGPHNNDQIASPPTAILPRTRSNNVIIPGIQNLGNTCYLSASLQTLFSVPSFITDLYQKYAEAWSANPSGDNETMPLTRALLEVAVVIGVLAEEDASCIRPEVAKPNKFTSLAANPSALKKQMDVLTDKFAGCEQRDAHEFLSDLVNFLHDELTASKSTPPLPPREEKEVDDAGVSSIHDRFSPNENRHPNKVDGKVGAGKSSTIKHGFASTTTTMKGNHGDLPTDEYFQLNVRVCLKCDSCGYPRSKDEMYRHLSVDLGEDSEQDIWTVEKGLKQFFQPEKRDVKCEKCQVGTTATQTLEVLSRPKALLLHFKRFIATQNQNAGPVVQNDDGTSGSPIKEMVLRKNKAKILLEETLSISQYGDNSNQILPWKYHLSGVVHHIGGTAFSGHYTSCVKRIVKDTQGDSSNTTNPQDNEEEWVRFDDQVGTPRPASYVLEDERNQRNCYLALYELNDNREFQAEDQEKGVIVSENRVNANCASVASRGSDHSSVDGGDDDDEDCNSVFSDKDYYKNLCARLTFALEARKTAHRECRQEKRRIKNEYNQLRQRLRDV